MKNLIKYICCNYPDWLSLMVHTRSMSSIESTSVFASLIGDKFKELKNTLIHEYKAVLDNYFELLVLVNTKQLY